MSTMQFVEVDVGGKKVKFESGLLARQAEGSLTVQMGETIVFSAVFLPLSSTTSSFRRRAVGAS